MGSFIQTYTLEDTDLNSAREMHDRACGCLSDRVCEVVRAVHTHRANAYPKKVEHRVGAILSQDCTPREDCCVYCIERPHEQERTRRSKPTNQGKTENSHQDSSHFNAGH